MSHRLERLNPKDSDAGRWRAVIETPQGSRNKLRYEPSEQVFTVSASLPAGMSFPFDFGFIPQTMAADGDPLDVLVLMDGPAYPGCILKIRLIGVMEAEQRERTGKTVRNDRLIAVADGTTERGDLRSLKDLDSALISQIEAFFGTYDALTGKAFHAIGCRGARVATRLLKAARV